MKVCPSCQADVNTHPGVQQCFILREAQSVGCCQGQMGGCGGLARAPALFSWSKQVCRPRAPPRGSPAHDRLLHSGVSWLVSFP